MTQPRLLGGRYEINGRLGYGGMAEVHLGRDTRLGRDIAVKVLRHDLARDHGFQVRFRREAQNAAALSHPSIVAVYDTGEELATDGVSLPYIVMEYVEGRTLREVLQAEGRLMPERALEITADVCAALEFSHRNGIVHRDIKPANVMLSPTGQVKVMDFGIARAVTQHSATMTQTSAVIGTAQYLSPEQARGETVDSRSDIYSTGCLLYELILGRPPFTGDSPVSVAYQHVREDPVPPSELNADISPAVDAVVLKALAKNPANRYQSAAEMRADLLRAAAGRPVEATPVLTGADRTQVIAAAPPPMDTTTLRRPPERDRRRGLWYLLLALAVIGVFLLAAFVTKSLISSGNQVIVPDEKGKTQTVAEDELRQLGFKVKITNVNRDDAQRGKVVDQSPPGQTKLDKGAAVTLTVDLGLKRVAVPALVGKTRDEATQALASLGLKAAVKLVDSDQPQDEVLSTNPAADQQVAVGSTVTVQVSKGTIAVPGVVGLSEDEATAKLKAAGFKVHPVDRESATDAPGTVISQSPASSSPAVKGSTVTIFVAKAPPPPSPTPPPTPTPTP